MNSVFAQYEELSSPQFAVINLSLRLRLITANFGLDNSSYRAQPHSIIVKCHEQCDQMSTSFPGLSCEGEVERRESHGLGQSILHSDWLTPYCLKITELIETTKLI